MAPPRFSEWLLARTIVAADRIAALGDLAEEFDARTRESGLASARRWYRSQVLRSIVPNLRRLVVARAPSPEPQAPSQGVFMSTLLQDLRFGWRMLRRRPLITLVAVGSLVVGLGAALVVFTLLNAVLLRPLPVQDPGSLAVVLERRDRGTNHNFSYQDYIEFRGATHGISEDVAYSSADATLNSADGAEVVPGELVSATFFPTLGIAMHLGRGLGPADEAPGAPPVVVVSETFWRSLRGSRPSLDGQTVALNGVPFAIVGVAAAPFRGMQVGRDARFWASIRQQPVIEPMNGIDLLTRPSASWLTVMGRLREVTSIGLVGRELTQQEGRLPKSNIRLRTREFFLEPGRQGDSMLPGVVASPLQLLLGAAGLVLLVACANVAGLLMARAGERQRELALRAALGASRGRLLRLLTSEALLLGMGLTVLAVFVAWLVAGAVTPLISSFGQSATLDVTADWRVLLFALATGLVATMLFGVSPLVATMRRTLTPALAEGSRSASGGRGQALLRKGLVVTQFALALGLVGAAALLGRTLVNLRTIPTGFDLDHIAVLEVDPRAPRPGAAATPDAEAARVSRYVNDGLERLAAVPGVRAVGFARILPLDFGGSRTTIAVAGYTPGADEDMEINYNLVTPGYFDALGLTPRDGRVFDGRDVQGAPRAAVVNESMARRYWPGQRAAGQTFEIAPDIRFTIVGVVPDVKYRMLREDPGPSFYLASTQSRPFAGAFHVRTAGSPDALMDQLRRVVGALDATVPITRARTLRAQANLNTNTERLALTIALALAGAAVILAAVGLFAAMSHAVGRRMREIGVRLALGAVPQDVRRLVLGEGVTLAIVGSLAGLGLAIGAGHLIRERLFGVGAVDVPSLVVAVAFLVLVALAAAWAPARRAAKIDPVHALRAE